MAQGRSVQVSPTWVQLVGDAMLGRQKMCRHRSTAHLLKSVQMPTLLFKEGFHHPNTPSSSRPRPAQINRIKTANSGDQECGGLIQQRPKWNSCCNSSSCKIGMENLAMDGLAKTAYFLCQPGKGLAALDESTGTIGKRLEKAGLTNDEVRLCSPACLPPSACCCALMSSLFAGDQASLQGALHDS